jgi:hypothetical protein
MHCSKATPADFGGVNFPLPWTTGEVFPIPVEFFHSFPFPKEEKAESSIESPKSSPPFEKGGTGGISGKAFLKR